VCAVAASAWTATALADSGHGNSADAPAHEKAAAATSALVGLGLIGGGLALRGRTAAARI
jgi:hypothetical protein